MIGIYVSGFLILCFGLLNLLGINQNLFWRQGEFFLIGLFIFWLIKKIKRNFFIINTSFFYWFFLGLLFSLFFLGTEVRGARRWLDLSFFRFQPSEFFKVFFIIFLARFLAKKTIAEDHRRRFILILFYFLLPTILIFKQPDLGNAIVFGVIFLTLVFASDLPKKYLLNLIFFLILMLPLGWFFLQPYQKLRLLSFFNPHLDTQGTAYNMIQSIITIGSGRFFGRGLGLGTQVKLLFLPENYTDFAFSSLCEQFGFFGGAVVIILFFLLCYFLVLRLFSFSNKKDEESRFNFLYLLGVLSFLVCQIVVNIGMNLGLVPIAGITLPLISYGGSSLVSLLMAVALMP